MWNNLAAALTFFTRLPFYKIKLFNVHSKHYKQAINYWPMVGWLTGGVMALCLWGASFIFPPGLAVLIALASRLLLTGALHEDGLSDFFDGLGGGTTRQRVLEIMKDSHIGVYGVIALIIYCISLQQTLLSFPLTLAPLIVLAGDPLAKFIASHINKVLVYARTEQTSKAKVVYDKTTPLTYMVSFLFGILPFGVLVYTLGLSFIFAIIAPIAVFVLIYYLLNKRIQGYTGDCCGATFLLCELSFYLSILLLLNW